MIQILKVPLVKFRYKVIYNKKSPKKEKKTKPPFQVGVFGPFPSVIFISGAAILNYFADFPHNGKLILIKFKNFKNANY